MKYGFTLAALLSLFTGVANAGDISVTQSTVAAGDLFSFTLDVTGMEGTFDTLDIFITPDSGSEFLNFLADGTTDGESAEATGVNAFIGAPTNFGGLGFSQLDGSAEAPVGTVSSATGIANTFGSLGNNEFSSSGNIFIANVLLPTGVGGDFVATLLDDGNAVARIADSFGAGGVDPDPDRIPEPTSVALIGLGIAGVVARRRRV